METSEQISADLKALLTANHTCFEFLNTYKGVPVICRAILQKVEKQMAYFQARTPEMVMLEKAKTTQILSEGLLEPIVAHIASFDSHTGKVELIKFAYAGSRLCNRKELRVEPGDPIEVALECDQKTCNGHLADISMRGIGARVAAKDECLFGQNKTVSLRLRLPEGEMQTSGRIRNISYPGDQVRLAIEFTGAGPEKTLVVRYILSRRSEIYGELHQILAEYEKFR